MGITVLGPLLVVGAGTLSRRDRVVLAALAVRAGHPVQTEELIDALWGEQAPSSAHKILQGCIVRLRKVLGPDAIETSTHGYVLTLPPDDLDSQRFERLVVRGSGADRPRPGGQGLLPADRGAGSVERRSLRGTGGVAASDA